MRSKRSAERKVVTVEEAARVTGKSVNMIKYYMSTGRLEYVAIAGIRNPRRVLLSSLLRAFPPKIDLDPAPERSITATPARKPAAGPRSGRHVYGWDEPGRREQLTGSRSMARFDENGEPLHPEVIPRERTER